MSTLSTRSPLLLPDHWTPEQALAAYEMLNELAASIWDSYQPQLLELIVAEIEQDEASQLDLFDFDDPIPF